LLAAETAAQAREAIGITHAPAASVNVSGEFAPDCANGEVQQFALTDAATLNAPTNATLGQPLTLWITASGADRDLTFNTAAGNLVIPSESSLAGTKTLLSGKRYILKLIKADTNWMLVSLVGGY
jgi:hypothetical protein